MKTQTFKLLKKEIFLTNSTQTIIWLICCFGMFFIPNYPVYIGPFYITLSIYMTFALNQASHDILYTVLLPVRKIDTVKARFLYCGLLEILAMLFGVIAGVIRNLANFPPSAAGTGLTIAYFGLQLIILSIFNFLFLGNVYKNPIKSGARYLFAGIMYFVCYAICELPVWIYYGTRNKISKGLSDELPFIAKIGAVISGSADEYLLPQLGILLAGLVIFGISWLITFKRSAKQFERYDI